MQENQVLKFECHWLSFIRYLYRLFYYKHSFPTLKNKDIQLAHIQGWNMNIYINIRRIGILNQTEIINFNTSLWNIWRCTIFKKINKFIFGSPKAGTQYRGLDDNPYYEILSPYQESTFMKTDTELIPSCVNNTPTNYD